MGEPLLRRSRWRAESAVRLGVIADAWRERRARRFDGTVSCFASAAQADDERLARWVTELGFPDEPRHRHNRKIWEWCFILDALRAADALRPGARAVCFGAGREPLPAVAAACGVEVVATDQAPAAAQSWVAGGQHAASLADLRHDHLCPPDRFAALVSFRPVDMTAIPGDLRDFDAAWSSCAFEHLGSPAGGHEFVLRSMECVRPGGVVVHTTEVRADGGPDHVLADGSTVLYSVASLQRLTGELRRRGHRVRLDLRVPWEHSHDRFIDTPPYRWDPAHLKLSAEGSVTSSFGLVVRRGR